MRLIFMSEALTTIKLPGNTPDGMGDKLPSPEDDTSVKNAGEEKGEKMELRELLGEELFGQVDAKIKEHNRTIEDALNHVRFVDLSEGGFVSKEKYKELETAKNGVDKQLKDANATIKSYKDMDIDGIKQSAADWEAKYEKDTAALNEQIETDRKRFAAERFLDGQKIKSPLSRKAILQEFLAQDLAFKDGAFVGADEYMKDVREKYPDEFETEENKPEKKQWVRSTQGSYKPQTVTDEKAYLDKKYGKNKYAQ